MLDRVSTPLTGSFTDAQPTSPPRLITGQVSSHQVKCQQCAQRLIIRNISAPAVSPRHSSIEGGVGIGQPLRAGVVEVGQGALLEFLGCLSSLRGTRRLG